MNAIATLDEAVAVLNREIANEDSFAVDCEVWRHSGDGYPRPREWRIGIHGEWVESKWKCESFRSQNLTECVQSALAWYREHRKAVTA